MELHKTCCGGRQLPCRMCRFRRRLHRLVVSYTMYTCLQLLETIHGKHHIPQKENQTESWLRSPSKRNTEKKPFGKLTWPLKTAISRRFTFEKMVIFAIFLFPRMLIPGFVQKNQGDLDSRQPWLFYGDPMIPWLRFILSKVDGFLEDPQFSWAFSAHWSRFKAQRPQILAIFWGV